MTIYCHWIEDPTGGLEREFFAQKQQRDVAARSHIAHGKKILCPNEYSISNAAELAAFLNTRFKQTTTHDLAEQYVNEVVLGGAAC